MAKDTKGGKEDRIIAVVAIGEHFGKQKGEVVGYYDHCRKRVGDRFKVRESEFSKKWMARLSEKVAKEIDEEEADLDADKQRKADDADVL